MTISQEAVAASPARVRRRVPRGLLLAFVSIVVLGPFVGTLTAQPASRVALSAALAEHRTVDVLGYPLGVDHSTYRGHLRSDKAPGQPFLAVPFYAVARAVGAESAAVSRLRGNLTLWWVTLWSCVVPYAALLALMRRAAARAAPAHATAVALALGAGTMLVPHATNLYGHVLSTLLGFGAYEVAAARPLGTRRAAAAGALAGTAIATEYHLVIVAVVVSLVVAVRGWRALAAFVAGSALPLAALAAYEWRAFGAPWHTPYAWYGGHVAGAAISGAHTPCRAQACATIGMPRAQWFFEATLSTRGLLFTSPIVLVGVVAAVAAARTSSRGGLRTDALVAVGVAAGYLLLVSGFSSLPLEEEPGPRFVIPMIPFLAVPLALVWRRWARVCRATACFGAVIAAAAATTSLLVARGQLPAQAYLERVRHGQFLPTVWSLALGRAGVLVYVLTAGAAVVWLARREWPGHRALRTGPRAPMEQV